MESTTRDLGRFCSAFLCRLSAKRTGSLGDEMQEGVGKGGGGNCYTFPCPFSQNYQNYQTFRWSIKIFKKEEDISLVLIAVI